MIINFSGTFITSVPCHAMSSVPVDLAHNNTGCPYVTMQGSPYHITKLEERSNQAMFTSNRGDQDYHDLVMLHLVCLNSNSSSIEGFNNEKHRGNALACYL